MLKYFVYFYRLTYAIMKKIWVLFFLLSLLKYSALGQLNMSYWLNNGINSIIENKNQIAIEYFNTILRFHPDMAEAYYYRGISKFNLSDFRGALSDFSMAVKNDTINSNYYLYRGRAKERLLDLNGALNDYNQAIALRPISSDAYLSRGINSLLQKKNNEAITDLNKSIGLNMKNAHAYFCRALAKQYSKEYEEAMPDFATAIKLDPKNSDYYTRRGINRFEMKDTIGSINDFNESIRIDSLNSFAYFSRALIKSQTSDFKGAMSDYNTVLRLDPENALTYYNRGGLKANMKNFKGAIEDYNKVLQINPNNYYTYFNRAIMWQYLENYRKAIEDYSSAIQLNPVFASAYYNRSLAKNAINDRYGAEMDRKAASAINANFDDILKSGMVDSSGLAKMAEFKADFGDADAITKNDIPIEINPFPNYLFLFDHIASGAAEPSYERIQDMNKEFDNEKLILSCANDSLSKDIIASRLNKLENLPVIAFNYTKLFERAVLKAQFENYAGSLDDFNNLISLNPQNSLVYFSRANIRYEMTLFMQSMTNLNNISISYGNVKNPVKPAHPQSKPNYEEIINDYTKCLNLEPGFYHAYFNRANMKIVSKDYIGAIWDFTRAIAYDPKFAEAYYNRGLTYIYIRKAEEGCQDLSKAGELGVDKAYTVIKKYCNN
jgi:tetratricopeptide (TPR) repeat protein